MPLTPELQKDIAARLRYYRDLGVFDFYQRGSATAEAVAEAPPQDIAQDQCRRLNPSPCRNPKHLHPSRLRTELRPCGSFRKRLASAPVARLHSRDATRWCLVKAIPMRASCL